MYAYKQLERAGINLTTSECAMLGLVGDSAHEKFKAVQKIIKESAPDTGLLSHYQWWILWWTMIKLPPTLYRIFMTIFIYCIFSCDRFLLYWLVNKKIHILNVRGGKSSTFLKLIINFLFLWRMGGPKVPPFFVASLKFPYFLSIRRNSRTTINGK